MRNKCFFLFLVSIRNGCRLLEGFVHPFLINARVDFAQDRHELRLGQTPALVLIQLGEELPRQGLQKRAPGQNLIRVRG